MLDTKKISSKNTGRGNTIIATSTIIPSGKIPDFIISDMLPDNDVLFFVNSMTLISPCQKKVVVCLLLKIFYLKLRLKHFELTFSLSSSSFKEKKQQSCHPVVRQKRIIDTYGIKNAGVIMLLKDKVKK